MNRRLLVFPRGNRVDQVAIYLDAPEAAWFPPSLNPKASFKLTIVDQNDPPNSFCKGGQGRATQPKGGVGGDDCHPTAAVEHGQWAHAW